MKTPKPMQGTWTLTSPDGRQWQAGSPLHTVSLEQRAVLMRKSMNDVWRAALSELAA